MSFLKNSFYRLSFLALLLMLFSCGAKKAKVSEVSESIDRNVLGVKAVIKNHYAGAANFKTLSGRLKIDYSSGNNSQGIPATFRMEKDKALWLSVFFGMGKAYITPKKVSFYSSVNKLSFEGDFEALSAYLGTPIDFNMLQNVLIGASAVDLKSQRFKLDTQEGVYRLKPQKAMAIFKLFVDLDPITYKVVQAQISQSSEESSLNISYPTYENMDGVVLPSSIEVAAKMGDSNAAIEISYKNVSANRPVSFPYKIPKGLKAISLPTHGE